MSDHPATVRRFSKTTEETGLVVRVEDVRPEPYEPPPGAHLTARH